MGYGRISELSGSWEAADHIPSPGLLTKDRGFTLVELLVVIAVIALIIGITLPALAGARNRSLGLKSQANVRSLTDLMLLRSEEVGGRFPGQDTRHDGPAFDGSEEYVLWWHWFASWPWYAGMTDIQQLDELLGSPGHRFNIEELYSQIIASNTMMGDPRLWSGAKFSGTQIVSMQRSQRVSSVAFPSHKGLLIDHVSWWNRREWDKPSFRQAVGFADGSADLMKHGDALLGIKNPGHGFGWHGEPVIETADGVLGRDYASR